MIHLSNAEWEQIVEYFEEIEAVIEADDGTLVPLPLLDKHEAMLELIYAIEER